jgi:adenylate kinase
VRAGLLKRRLEKVWKILITTELHSYRKTASEEAVFHASIEFMEEQMHKKFYIIIGRSGSGKGTQADLLGRVLLGRGAKNVLHTTTGGGFREFIEGDSYAAKLSKEVTNSGGLGAEFLAIWNWSNIFIKSITGSETVILDGAPRRMAEVDALHSAIKFFGYEKPTVMYLDVSEGWAMDKLASRGREDDNLREEQERKMEWFNADVLPCVDAYSRDPRYAYIHVNGEQSVEEVHKELIEKLDAIRN